ncbi:Gfo/Idh/MocA family oxidoreductase [Saccharopolyspora sp. K220]|uniref:Gfo/Idh/MocA family protein n=1 Tax=Saccharopolyspora soli TaxID=2926618 RepID=UPI001F5721ED|nr:Gfo/Idh/MocA family oxidoreductase [Saccharopolyspora soli]MCI2419537.1 Gfo/Idh/MocA family oxidoreductase [Saccharopolyspora soli]
MTVVRVAIFGVSHWHLDLYLPTLLAMDQVDIIGVSDPSAEVARRVGQQLGCAWSPSYAQLSADTRPEFVLALGTHAEMFGEASHLLDHRIPFAMEKPCGLNAAEVRALANRCERENAFAAVPFVWRHSELLQEMRARFDPSAVDYLSLRWIAGPPTRYSDSGCDWMLDPARSGGGCTVNLSVHLIDLTRVIFGEHSTRVATAVMSNRAYGLPIEDYSLVVLRNGKRTALVETGYLRPGRHSEFDMRFSIRARDHYVIATGPEEMEVFAPDGRHERLRAHTTNVAHYPVFVRDVLRRLAAGEPPMASMTDMAEVMELVADTYTIAATTQGGSR